MQPPLQSKLRQVDMGARRGSETTIRLGTGVALKGFLEGTESATGLIIFVHGSGSSRFSVRNNQVAQFLRSAGFATLLMDLLTAGEDRVDAVTRELRFNIPLLAERVRETLDWLARHDAASGLPIGLFGASTGAAAALIAAASQPTRVRAVVSRGGRPDLAADALESVQVPTLLIVGSEDTQVLELNRMAMSRIPAETRLVTIEGATHLFEEPGTLEQVAQLAADWFSRFLRAGMDRR
jgi:pimeloyl-ACP methyl ester carboxylesterase